MTVRVWTCWFCQRLFSRVPGKFSPGTYCSETCALADLSADILKGYFRRLRRPPGTALRSERRLDTIRKAWR